MTRQKTTCFPWRSYEADIPAELLRIPEDTDDFVAFCSWLGATPLDGPARAQWNGMALYTASHVILIHGAPVALWYPEDTERQKQEGKKMTDLSAPPHIPPASWFDEMEKMLHRMLDATEHAVTLRNDLQRDWVTIKAMFEQIDPESHREIERGLASLENFDPTKPWDRNLMEALEALHSARRDIEGPDRKEEK